MILGWNEKAKVYVFELKAHHVSCYRLPSFLADWLYAVNSDWPILHFMAKLMSSTWMISDACQTYDELGAGRLVINYVLCAPLVLIRYFFLWIKWPIPCLHFLVELLSGRLEPKHPLQRRCPKWADTDGWWLSDRTLFFNLFTSFLDTGLSRGKVQERNSGHIRGAIPTQSHNPWRLATPLGSTTPTLFE